MWLLDTSSTDSTDTVSLHCGTEPDVRAEILAWIGESWPEGWTLRRVVLEDELGRRRVAQVGAALETERALRDELEALRAQARTLAAEAVGLRRALAQREELAQGPALRETPAWPEGLRGLAAREAL